MMMKRCVAFAVLSLCFGTQASEPERGAIDLQVANTPSDQLPIEWCRTDGDCQQAAGPGLERDVLASCNIVDGTCTCSPGFRNMEIEGVMHYECYPVNTLPGAIARFLVRLLLKIYLALANCALGRDTTIRERFISVVLGVLGIPTSRFFGMTDICGSLHAGLDVQMTKEDISSKLPSLDAELSKKLNEDSDLKNVLGTEATSTFTVVEENECDIDYATKTVSLTNSRNAVTQCSAISCEFGQPILQSSTSAYTCLEPQSNSDDDLSDGAIVGIVLGSLAFCCILLALCFCFFRNDNSEAAAIEQQNRAQSPLKNDEGSYKNHGEPFDQDTFSEGDMEFSDVQV